MKAPQNGHAGPYAVSTLDSYQTRDDSVPVSLFEFATGSNEPHLRRVLGREPPHHVDLLEGELDRVQELGLAWHVGRPKLRTDYASTQTNQVGLPAWAPGCVFRQIYVEWKVAKMGVSSLFAQIPGEIVVSEKKKL